MNTHQQPIQEPTHQPRKIYYIEGNISCGKTTVIENLRFLGYAVFEEPLDVWQREYVTADGQNILGLFYSDMRAWGFKFEMVSLMTRYKQLRAALNALRDHNVVFIERSLMTDRHVFALNLYHNKLFDEIEWKIYCDWHDLFMELVTTLLGYEHALTDEGPYQQSHLYSTTHSQTNSTPHPTTVRMPKVLSEYIYIQTPPDVCFERKIGRNRGEESEVMPKYFNELHDKHEDWLSASWTYGEDVGTTAPPTNVRYHAMEVARVHIIKGYVSREEVLKQIVDILGPDHLIKKLVSLSETEK